MKVLHNKSKCKNEQINFDNLPSFYASNNENNINTLNLFENSDKNNNNFKKINLLHCDRRYSSQFIRIHLPNSQMSTVKADPGKTMRATLEKSISRRGFSIDYCVIETKDTG